MAQRTAAPDMTTAAATVEQTLQRSAALAMELHCPDAAPVASLRLSEAVMRALCNDPRTRVSWAAVRAQQAEVLQRRLARWPTATGSIEVGRGISRERSIDAETQRLSGGTSATGLQLQWVLWDFGQRSSRESAAEQALLAAAAGHDQTIQQSMLSVVQAYLNVAEAQGAVKLSRESEKFTRDLLAEAQRPAKKGQTSLDQLGEKQARTSLWSQVLDLRRADGQLARARGELAVLMGLPVQSIFAVELPAARGNGTSMDASLLQMINDALEAYPPLREAQARVSVAKAELEEARRSDWPVVAASAGQQNSRTPALPGLVERNIGLRVDVPLSSWFERRHRVDRAQAQLDAAHQALRQTQKDIELEVWLSYQNLRENTAALRVAERFRLSAEDLLRAELQAFRTGDSDMFDVLDANSSRTEAASAELSSLTALNLARARLASSLGQLARMQLPAALTD
jgi:outer membrane protein